jgi:hypothetical protein
MILTSTFALEFVSADGNVNTIDVSLYTDPRYQFMEPVYCGVMFGSEHCLLIVDDMFGVPIMNHFGSYDWEQQGTTGVKRCEWFVSSISA